MWYPQGPFQEGDLLTCKNQQKKTKKNNNTKSQGKTIDNISLALMKQFNKIPKLCAIRDNTSSSS